MNILTLDEIKQRIDLPSAIKAQEEGFVLYSQGKVDAPMPGYLEQQNPPGSYHIKYGLINNDTHWVAKIAGGPKNKPLNGMMVAISTQTGEPEYLLVDNGYLTQLRTAIAGQICARYCANPDIKNIGIVGTGEQARWQLKLLAQWTDVKNVYVWGRLHSKAKAFQREMSEAGYQVKVADSISMLASNCNLIVTTTGATEPLISLDDIRPGTHITAMGADAPGKCELDPHLVAAADKVFVDSKKQCIHHGEIEIAVKKKLLSTDALIELGQVIANPELGRVDKDQITIADLTGIAPQDIQIVKSVIGAG